MDIQSGGRKEWKAVALVVLSMVFYGISFPMTRIALVQYRPITIVTARLIVSSFLLMSFNLWKYGFRGGLPKKPDIPSFVLIAFFQPFLYFLLETYGLETVSAAISSVIIATIPVFTPIFTRVLLNEKLTVYPIAGAVLSLLGVVFMVVIAREDTSQLGSFSLKGLFLLLGAVFSAVLYSLAVRKLPVSYSPITITAVQNSIGLILFLPLFAFYDAEQMMGVTPSLETVMSIVFLAVFASSLAFIFLNFGIQRLGPTRANGMVNLVPVVTAVVSFLFFGEHFSTVKIIGILIVLSGVIVAQRRR